MENFEKQDIELLKNAVEDKFGSRILYAKDCAVLSNAIFDKTSAKISLTTIKRLWNLVNSPFNPSKYTLNSLAAYVGYNDYEAFVDSKNNLQQSLESKNVWRQIQQKAKLVSQKNFQSITSRMGIELKNTVKRKFASKKLEAFLNSDKTATAFIAPGGYGKSTITVSLVYDYFLSDDAKFPDDIIWLIDCPSISGLETEGFNIDEFLLSLLGYADNKTFKDYFERNPLEAQGRVVIFFDGLNELKINGGNGFLQNLIRVIAANSGQTNIKMIFTLRPDLWTSFCKIMDETSGLKKCWFDVEFSPDPRISSNIPPLKMEEVEQVLVNNGAYNFSNIATLMHGGFTNIARIPYFLHIYVLLWQSQTGNISDIDLLREYMVRKIIEPSDGAASIELIDKILKCSNFGLDSDFAIKDNITPIIKKYNIEFNNLLNNGIVYEQKQTDFLLNTKTYIKFTHSILFEFLLANHWLRKYGFTEKLIKTVSDFYDKNLTLKHQIISWIIKYAFKENRTGLVKDIFKIALKYFPKDTDDNNILKRLIIITGLELRKFPEEERNRVLEYFAQDNSSRVLYYVKFCDLDNLNGFYGYAIEKFFLKYANDDNQKIYGFFVKLVQNVFNKNRNGIIQYYEEIKRLSNNYVSPQIYSLILTSQLYYFKNIEKEIPTSIVDYIVSFAKENFCVENTDIQKFNFSFVVLLDGLILCKKYQTVREICMSIPDFDNMRENHRYGENYVHILMIYSYALLKLGYIDKGNKYFSHLEIIQRSMLSANAASYWTMRYSQIAREFYPKDTYQYADHTQKMAAIAKYLKFPFFTISKKTT